MITTHPSSDTQKKLRALEAQVAYLKGKRAEERKVVAVALELVAAEQEAENLTRVQGTTTGEVSRRLKTIDRLHAAHRAMRQLMKIKPVEEPEEEEDL